MGRPDARLRSEMRLYVMQLATTGDPPYPVPGYLIQTDDGTNVLIDTGFPREMVGAYREATEPGARVDEEEYVVNRLAAA